MSGSQRVGMQWIHLQSRNMDPKVSRALGKEIRSQFTSRFLERFPYFQVSRPKVVPAHCEIYAWPMTETLTCYLVLNVDAGERFSLDLSWTRNGRWPGGVVLPVFRPRSIESLGVKEDEPRGGDFRFMLNALWLDRGSFEWEILPRPSLDDQEKDWDQFMKTGRFDVPPTDVLTGRIPALILDAVDRMETYAIPYLQSICERYS